MSSTSAQLLIVMPVYNEEESLGRVIEEWSPILEKCDGHLLLINDGSKDRTAEVMKRKAQQFARIKIIDRANKGHGPTIHEGYRFAVEHHYPWVFQTDSDGQTRPNEFFQLWEAREGADFLFGRRGHRGDGKGREIISFILRTLIKLIFGVWLRDANVPFRLMKTEKLAPLLKRVPEDFFLTNSLLSVMIGKRYPIRWFDITFEVRKGGIPSIRWGRFVTIGIKAARDFWNLRDHV